MSRVFIGVDPHKLSATIEVVDDRETVLATGRFATDKAGYAAMRRHVASYPDRVWAVEGSNGAGRLFLDDGRQAEGAVDGELLRGPYVAHGSGTDMGIVKARRWVCSLRHWTPAASNMRREARTGSVSPYLSER